MPVAFEQIRNSETLNNISDTAERRIIEGDETSSAVTVLEDKD